MRNLAVCALVMDPTNSNILFAGTGEGFGNIDAIRGNGIFRTTDGWNWTSIEFTRDNSDFFYVNSLVITSNGQRLFAGTKEGIFVSSNAQMNQFQHVLQSVEISNIAINPNDDNKLVAGSQSGIAYYSTNGGQSWHVVTLNSADAERIQVTYARHDPSIVYALIGTRGPGNKWGTEFWKSDDGGQTYTQKDALNPDGNPSNLLGGQGWYNNQVWAGDPTDADLIIVGGIDLWKSADGGDTFKPISTWYSDLSVHSDQHAIVPDPGYDGTTNTKVYIGNDGGIYVTDDIKTAGNNAQAPYTNGWKNLNVQYGVTQFYYGAGNPATNVIIGGTQDNGSLRFTPATGDNDWNSFFGGDGGAVAADPGDPQTYYGEYVRLQIFRNSDGGASDNATDYICGRYWVKVNGEWEVRWKPAPYTIDDARDKRAAFIAPFVLDPNNANCLLGGGRSLWRTNNPKAPVTDSSGPSWSATKSAIGNARSDYISAIAVAQGNSDIILVGHANGRIYRTVNGAQGAPTWERIDDNGPTPINSNRKCLSIYIDPKDHNVYYATFSGYQADNVWKSTTGGQSWTNLAVGQTVPNSPIHCVTVHPQNSDWIYLATEVGIVVSEDGGRNWTPTNSGPANVACTALFWMSLVGPPPKHTLVCVTHGRGMFQIDLTIKDRPDALITGDTGGTIYAVSAANGAQTATKTLLSGHLMSQAKVEKDTIYLGDGDGDANVYALGAQTLTERWRTELPGHITASPQIYTPQFSSNKILVASSANGHLYGLDEANGARLWDIDVLGLSASDSKRIFSNFVMDDWCFMTSEAGLYAVNLITRTLAWSNSTISCSAPPLLAASRVFAPASDGSLHAFTARGGANQWSIQTGGASQAQPAWILGSVIFANSDGELIGIHYNSGQEVFRLTKPGEDIQSVATDGNIIYFAGNAANGRLYAYEVTPSTGNWALTEKWSIPLSKGASRSTLIVGDNLYLTTLNKDLRAFRASNGAQQWIFSTPHDHPAAPAAVFT